MASQSMPVRVEGLAVAAARIGDRVFMVSGSIGLVDVELKLGLTWGSQGGLRGERFGGSVDAAC